MKNNSLKIGIWDMPSYLIKIENESRQITKNLTDSDLEGVAGGKMDKKLLSSVLASVTLFASSPVLSGNVYAQGLDSSISTKASASVSIQNSTAIEFLSREQVIQDINFVMDKIKQNHVSAVDKIPDEIKNQYDLEVANLSDSTSKVEEYRIVSRILARLHDAHTIVGAPKSLHKRLPFDTYLENAYRGNYFCVKDGEFKGYKIDKINGVSMEDIYEQFKKHFSYEIEEWPRANFYNAPDNFIPGWKLALAGIDTSKPLELTFSKDGELKNKTFELAEITQENKLDEPWVSYKIDKENDIATFTLNKCNWNNEYIKTVDKFFEEVYKNGVKNIIVDLRKNTGGNSLVINYFALYIEKLKSLDNPRGISVNIRNGKTINHINGTFPKDEIAKLMKTENLFNGNIFITTSNFTFSSALQFAVMFKDNNLATIVGDAPGNSPTHYGNITESYCTPNSKLVFHTTFKKFYRDPSKNQDRVIPDIQVPAKDAIEAVLKEIK